MGQRIQIDLCPVDCLNFSDTVAGLLDAMDEGRRVMVAPANAYTVVEARRNPALRAALAQMDLILPDGFWLQVAARVLRRPSTHHVPTVPLTYELLRAMACEGDHVYLLGARDEVVHAAAARLRELFPGLVVVGTHDGYFTEEEEPEVLRKINAVHPDLLLIGISSPRRDLLMARWRDALDVPVTIGVGGLLDILGGRTPEGPSWLRRIGMMWLYRLLQEPRRLWKRYTVTNTLFILYVMRQALNGRNTS